MKQFAFKIKGEIRTIKEGKIIDLEKVTGKITPSRIILLNSETITPDHHNFGNYLLTIEPTPNWFKGTRTFLCIDCGSATATNVFWEKES